jgi:cyanophycin synthetase
MRIIHIQTLKGPNVWSRHPILEAVVDLEELKDSPSNTLPGFYERLSSWIPSLVEHRCSVGERGGFLQRLKEGTWPGHILEHTALELETLAGTAVGFGKTRETSTPGVYKVAVRYVEERLGRACLTSALEILLAAVYDRPLNISSKIAELREIADSVCLGPSAQAVVDAAKRADIPVRRLNDGNLVLLGQGIKQRRIWMSETDQTSAVAESIAQDKQLTRTLLQECGVKVPEGRVVSSPEEAWTAADEIGIPVVVKPRDGSRGRDVFIGLSRREDIEHAYRIVDGNGAEVIVEQLIQGGSYRLLVIDGCVTAAATSEPAMIVGDGTSTVRSLIDTQINASRLEGFDKYPAIDLSEPVVQFELKRQNVAVDDVPKSGSRIRVQQTGSAVRDVTDDVHPETAEQAVIAARVVGLNIAGVDIVASDISRPLEDQGGRVVEVNAGPGLYIHLKPSSGKPRPVGEAVLNGLFKQGESGRIPLACVMGTSGKTTVARMLDCMLIKSKRHVGLACSDGIFQEGRLVRAGNRTDAASSRDVLLDPAVDAAVVEASVSGIACEGLGFDRCDVAVVTNLGEEDYIGSGVAESKEALFDLQRCAVDVLLPTGCAVLNGDDPVAADMARLFKGDAVLFSRRPDCPEILDRIQAGLRAVILQEGRIVLARKEGLIPLAEISRIPISANGRFDFQIENCMAASAAAWALGLSPEVIRGVLLSFGANYQDAPGRGSVFTIGGVTVVIDRADNARACAALLRGVGRFEARHRVVVALEKSDRDEQRIIRRRSAWTNAFGNSILTGAQALNEGLSDIHKGDLLVVLVDDVHIKPIVEVIRKRFGSSGFRRVSMS